MDEEIKRLMELWPKYPISKEKQVHFITETWSFKSESIEEAKRAFEYFKLWKENILHKWYFYDFIDDQLVYYPLWGDTFSSLTQPATLSLKIALKSKASEDLL
jgi:hypothetical protein